MAGAAAPDGILLQPKTDDGLRVLLILLLRNETDDVLAEAHGGLVGVHVDTPAVLVEPVGEGFDFLGFGGHEILPVEIQSIDGITAR